MTGERYVLPQPKPAKRERKARKRIRTRRPAGTVRREAKAAGDVDPDTLGDIAMFYGWRCGYCETAPGKVWDHRVAIAHGGKHEVANLVLACEPCNMRKGTQTWEPKRRHPWMEKA